MRQNLTRDKNSPISLVNFSTTDRDNQAELSYSAPRPVSQMSNYTTNKDISNFDHDLLGTLHRVILVSWRLTITTTCQTLALNLNTNFFFPPNWTTCLQLVQSLNLSPKVAYFRWHPHACTFIPEHPVFSFNLQVQETCQKRGRAHTSPLSSALKSLFTFFPPCCLQRFYVW